MDQDKRKRLLTLGLLLLWAAVVLIWHLAGGGLFDEGYLQLHYAGQLASGEAFRVNPEDPTTDAAANPLLVALLVPGHLIGGSDGAQLALCIVNALLLLGWLFALRGLARVLGAVDVVGAVAVGAALLCAPLIDSTLGGDPHALSALLLAWAVNGVLRRRPGIIVPATTALMLTGYAGMFAGLVLCAAVPAVDILKGERLDRRLLWLLLPFALAAFRALLARTFWEISPLGDVLAPLSTAPGAAPLERFGIILRLPLETLRRLGGTAAGMLVVSLVVAFAIPRARWRLSVAMGIIALAVGGLVIRGDRLVVLWLAPLVVMAAVVWSAKRAGGDERRWIAVVAAVLMTLPGLAVFRSQGVPADELDFFEEVVGHLPRDSSLAVYYPGLYLQAPGLRVTDLSGALPPFIGEYRRQLDIALESRVKEPRYRRPRFVVSDGATHDGFSRTPLLHLVLEDAVAGRGLWRLDWIPLERSFGLWEPEVVERLRDRRLVRFVELGGDPGALEGIHYSRRGGAAPYWGLLVHEQSIGGRTAPVADTCLIFDDLLALRLDLILPDGVEVACLRLSVSGASELEIRSEAGTSAAFHEVDGGGWDEIIVESVGGSRLLNLTFKGLGTGSRLALGSIWYFR